MNALVPYLDLFGRLADGELSKLAEVSDVVVAELRVQVQQVKHSLADYVDLLPRLSDEELARVSGVPEKTIRFWRLCRPKSTRAREAADAAETRQQPGLPASASQSGSVPVEGVTGDVFPGFETEPEVDESDLDLEIESWVDGDDLELEEL